MLETIKEQFSKGKTLSKNPFYQQHQTTGSIYGELYPLSSEYFHELNPALLFKMDRIDFLKQYPAITVRDGAITLGDFILKNFHLISKIKTQFIIHPDLARLVPTNLKSSFSSWSIIQKNKTSIKDAKCILIIGIINEQILPDLVTIKKQFEVLRKAPKSTPIEVYLPIRSNPFGLPWKESYVGYQLVEILKEIIPNHKISYITLPKLTERTSWSETYCLDLMTNNLAISDSSMNHYMATRGASISVFKDLEETNSYFELDLSLNHKIQFSPLPEVESIFPEMIFYKKQASTQAYYSDPRFHALLRQYNF
jgi:hypothetical protein